MYNMSNVITIRVNGRNYEAGRDILSKFPESTLGRVAASEQEKVIYQRPTNVFKRVLAYYQTGHLHVPLGACPGSIHDELVFWGFTIDDLDPCCRRNLKKFYKEQADYKSFEKFFSDSEDSCKLQETRLARGRRFLWLILDKPFSSVSAKIYFVLSSLMVILSTVTVFLASMKSFKEEMTPADWKEYFGPRYDLYKERINGKNLVHDNTNINMTISNLTLPTDLFVGNKQVSVIQTTCVAFFTIELILKLLCCPNILHFLKSIYNIIDIIAVAVSWADIVAEFVSLDEKYKETSVDALGGLQVFRVLRLLRLAKNITGAKVLGFAMLSSYKEIIFMLLLVAINTILFGTLAYSFNKEVMEDLSVASWWALVTMTTVGYGDVVPKNHAGRLVGVLCACMGILILALTVPLFVDNFLTFYSYGNEMSSESSSKKSKTTPQPTVKETERI